MGENFNQKINLPFNIKSLRLDTNNGSFAEYLPDTIEELNLWYNFNLDLNNLPSSIKKINFYRYHMYNRELNCLPNGLSILKLPYEYDKRICSIPCALKKLICSKDYPYIGDFNGIEVETYLE